MSTQVRGVRAPSFAALRPFRPANRLVTNTFPVYRDLVELLLRAHAEPGELPWTRPEEALDARALARDAELAKVAHVLATLAGYAYSDETTVAVIAARLGLEENRCAMVAQSVDAMFICSTAFLIQSRCGRIAILCYRGTEPNNLINWLTDADVNPEVVAWRFPEQKQDEPTHFVHAGFYRNVRATRYAIGERLAMALEGRSILDGKVEEGLEPLQALYVTGHSLGAAMASLLRVMMETNADYAPVRRVLRATYTFGQPMIGDEGFAAWCQKQLGTQVYRFIHAHDVVPALPPRVSGDFAHFGAEYGLARPSGAPYVRPAYHGKNMPQISHLFELPLAAGVFLARQLRSLRDIPFQYSLDDHGPQHYVSALTPPGVRTEFGD